MIYGWNPTIGDPTVYGWVTVVAYFGASWLCYRNWRRNRVPSRPGPGAFLAARARRRFWFAATAIVLLLGINKQLDVQTLFTDIGRATAKGHGWYDARRGVQRAFIAAIAMLALVCAIALPIATRRAGRWELLCALGLIGLFAFVCIRAASFHHIDMILGSGWAGVKVNHVMELGGIAVVALAAHGRARAFRGA